ncbi:MAG: methyltransferase domain-containing protein [Pirellulaceae bacterium]|nr:methyltransferase domain-containing protein [Pirellulaceae bacterium]
MNTANCLPTSSTTSLKPIQGCRFCGEQLRETCVDLGVSPLCESWLAASDLNKMEPFYPLHVYVCHKCFLVQVNEYVSGEEIFGGEYAYFSSYSDSWLAHAKRYAHQAIDRWKLGSHSQVVELASNDGYLLQYFVEQAIPVLGIEPAENCAAVAIEKGIRTLCKFFGVKTATELREQGCRADLLIGNNVLAHVPDLNDFVGGIKVLLADRGVNTMEFPHLVTTMEGNQFDSMYQEHYCYLSFHTIEKVFAAHGLTLFDVDEIPTHGGSLRIYARHAEDDSKPVSQHVTDLRRRELEMGYGDLAVYREFGEKVIQTKHKLLDLLIRLRREGKQVAGYGAPGKAATLLNYCGIREDLIAYTVDRNPYKHGRFMPGVRIPVFPTEKIRETRPDYVVVLPWNLKDEIMQQLSYIREWGGKFVLPIPEAVILDPS